MIYDAGGDKYPLLCEKYDGRRGRPWQEWSAQWLDLMAGCGDDDASLAQTLLNTDPQVGLTPAQVKRRERRRRESYSLLIRHISDPELVAVIRNAAGGAKTGAP